MSNFSQIFRHWSFQFDQPGCPANVNGQRERERGHKLIEYFGALSMPFIVWVSPGWVSFAAVRWARCGGRVLAEKDELCPVTKSAPAPDFIYLFANSLFLLLWARFSSAPSW